MKKRKIILSVVVLFVFCSALHAKIMDSRFKITESEEEFDVIYYMTDDMEVISPKKNDDVAITQAFRVSKDGYEGELRYSLFTDCGGNDDDLKIQYAMWVFICSNNIAGYDLSKDTFSNFNDSDVKTEFNGDFGCTGLIQNPESEYGEGYKYIMVDFFYKKDQGLVMRTFLFNDLGFVGMSEGKMVENNPWFDNYHSFKFMDK